MKEYLAAAATAHHPAVLVSLSSSSARVEEDIAVLAILTFSSSVRNFGPHLNEGGHRRRLFPPPRFILSSSSTAVLEWRRTLSPPLPTVQRSSLASRPVVQQCRRSQCGTLPPPPLPTTRRCSSASHLAVQQCHCARCRPTEEYIA